MMGEIVTTLLLVSTGGVIVAALGGRGILVAILALPSGIAIVLAVALVQATLPVPSWPLIAGIAAFVIALVTAVVARARVVQQWRWLLLALLVAGVISLAHVWLPVTTWTTDSIFNLEVSRLLVLNERSMVDWGAVEKRQLAVPVLHGLGAQLGAGDVVGSAGPLLLASTVALLAWLMHRLLRVRGRVIVWALPAVSVLVVVTMHRAAFAAFYVNGHMLVACLLLMVVGLLWLRARGDLESGELESGDRRALLFLAVVAVPALVVARPEGALVLILVIAPLLRCDRAAASALAVVTGGAAALWNVHLVVGASLTGSEASLSSWAMLGVGVLLVLSPLVVRALPSAVVDRAGWVVEGGLWLMLVVLTVRDPSTLVQSVLATGANVLLGEGGWGASFAILAVIAVVVVILVRGEGDDVVRSVVTAFVPLALVLAFLREGAYRVGEGDSLNRMWLHILPVLVLFVVHRVLHGMPRWRRRTEAAPVASVAAQ